ncbi:High mobility group protein B3, partial [Ophiophagus hannah]
MSPAAILTREAFSFKMAKGDPKKPKGKMSAYAFFVQTCREEHKKKNPEVPVNFAEFSKKCSERWKLLVVNKSDSLHPVFRQVNIGAPCPEESLEVFLWLVMSILAAILRGQLPPAIKIPDQILVKEFFDQKLAASSKDSGRLLQTASPMTILAAFILTEFIRIESELTLIPVSSDALSDNLNR